MSAREDLFGFVVAGAEEADLPTFAAALDAYRAEVLAEAADAIVAKNDRVLWATKPGKHWAADLVRRMARNGGAK